MKKIALILIVAGLVSAGGALVAYQRTASSLFQLLGIQETEAQNFIWMSFSGGNLRYPTNPNLAQIPRADRASLVAALGTFAKSYTHSREFAARYGKDRDSRRPAPPGPARSLADMKKTQRDEMQKSIREFEANLKSMPAAAQASAREALNAMREQLKALDDPNNPMFSKEMEQATKAAAGQETENYKNELAEWEKKNPANPDQMIRQRLREFLEVSQDVDFGATLVKNQYGKMIFTKPEYEGKPGTWKLCFRAGKETVESARAFAKQWLAELGGTK